MQGIPKLSALVPLRFPDLLLMPEELGYGALDNYKAYYFEHPRSFLSRFLVVLKETIHCRHAFWYVLELGKNHFLSLRHDQKKFTMEKVHVKIVRTVPSSNENVMETVFHRKTWTSPEAFLDQAFQFLLHHPPTRVINYYNNLHHAEYTPAQFLQKTIAIPFRAEQLSRRHQAVKGCPDLGPGVSSTQRAETNFDRLLTLDPWGVSDWYECMGFSPPKRSRHARVRADVYEPPEVYKKFS